MVTIYVIRHGETEANRGGIFQGHLDVPLSERGLRQAELVAKALSNIHFDAVYTSDLSRAAETARAIMKYQDCGLILDRRLRELYGGELQGLTQEQVSLKYPEFDLAFAKDRYNTRRPGGESFADLDQRVATAMEDIRRWNADRPGGATVAVVSHGGAIRSILKTADPDPLLIRQVVGNCTVSVLECEGTSWRTVKAGDGAHLACLEGEMNRDRQPGVD